MRLQQRNLNDCFVMTCLIPYHDALLYGVMCHLNPLYYYYVCIAKAMPIYGYLHHCLDMGMACSDVEVSDICICIVTPIMTTPANSVAHRHHAYFSDSALFLSNIRNQNMRVHSCVSIITVCDDQFNISEIRAEHWKCLQ